MYVGIQYNKQKQHWAIPEKKQTGGVEDMMEFPGDIEARKCGNSKGKLKKKQKFQGCSSKQKLMWNFIMGSF